MDIVPGQVLIAVLGLFVVIVLAVISGAFFMGKLAQTVSFIRQLLEGHIKQTIEFRADNRRELRDLRDRILTLENHGPHDNN